MRRSALEPEQYQSIVDAVAEDTGLPESSVRSVLESVQKIKLPARTEVRPSDAKRMLPLLQLKIDDSEATNAGADPKRTRNAKNKIGGDPDWVQNPMPPACCGTVMTFYGQFDSNLGGEYAICDCGVLYVFYCESCLSTESELQFY